MLVEDPLMHAPLRRIVAGLTQDSALSQDLMQEGLIQLWKLESAKPGQTRSWYVQGCQFHLRHCLASGRSVDSLKRSGQHNWIPIEEDEPSLQEFHTNGESFETVSFRDIVSTLCHHLKPRERQILNGLAAGMGLREIASALRLSYPTALKARRTIAALMTKLEGSADMRPLLILLKHDADKGAPRKNRPMDVHRLSKPRGRSQTKTGSVAATELFVATQTV